MYKRYSVCYRAITSNTKISLQRYSTQFRMWKPKSPKTKIQMLKDLVKCKPNFLDSKSKMRKMPLSSSLHWWRIINWRKQTHFLKVYLISIVDTKSKVLRFKQTSRQFPKIMGDFRAKCKHRIWNNLHILISQSKQ